MAADALQDALARLDDHVSMLDDLRDNLWRISSGNLRLTGAVGMLDFCRRGLDDVLSAIRAAHNLPASAASPSISIPPSAPLPAAADTGRALSCDGVRPTFIGDKEKGGNAEARRQGD